MYKKVVKVIPPQNVPEYQDLIEMFLQEQPESYSAFFTLDEYIWMIQQGILTPWIYYVDEEPMGLVVTSSQQYTKDIKSLKIEFLSCKNFFAMTSILPVVETYCQQQGYTYLEAIAHPILAEVGVKKHGFSAPNVYIRKTVAYQRRN